MPLKRGFSKEVVGHNIRAELAAGKARDQALAIALSKAKEAQDRRSMWLGGVADDEGTEQDDDLANQFPERQSTTGEPHANDDDDEEEEPGYSDGGMVSALKEDIDPTSSILGYDYKLKAPEHDLPQRHQLELGDTHHADHLREEDMMEMAKKLKKFHSRRY